MGAVPTMQLTPMSRAVVFSAVAFAVLVAMSTSDASPVNENNEPASPGVTEMVFTHAKNLFRKLTPSQQEHLNALSLKLPSSVYNRVAQAAPPTRSAPIQAGNPARRLLSPTPSSSSRRRADSRRRGNVYISSCRRRSSCSSGLAGGIIALIIIGPLLCIIIVAVILCCCCGCCEKKKKQNPKKKNKNNREKMKRRN